MLWQYLKIWEWEWIFRRAVKAISSLGVRSPCLIIFRVAVYSQISTSDENDEPMIMIIMAWVSFRSSNWNFHKVHQVDLKVL